MILGRHVALRGCRRALRPGRLIAIQRTALVDTLQGFKERWSARCHYFVHIGGSAAPRAAGSGAKPVVLAWFWHGFKLVRGPKTSIGVSSHVVQ